MPSKCHCGQRAVYGPDNGAPTHCWKHRDRDMINIAHAKSVETKRAMFENEINVPPHKVEKTLSYVGTRRSIATSLIPVSTKPLCIRNTQGQTIDMGDYQCDEDGKVWFSDTNQQVLHDCCRFVWDYPTQSMISLDLPFETVHSGVFTDDCSKVIVSTKLNVVVFQLDTGLEISRFKNMSEPICLNKTTFLMHSGNTVQLCNMLNGSSIIAKVDATFHSYYYAFNDRQFASGDRKFFAVFDIATCVRVFSHPYAFTPIEGRQPVVSLSGGKKIMIFKRDHAHVYDMETGAPTLVLGYPKYGPVPSIIDSGRELVANCMDRKVEIVDVDTNLRVSLLVGHRGRVTRVAFMPDCTRTITMSFDSIIRVFSHNDGVCMATLANPFRCGKFVSIGDNRVVVEGDHQMAFFNIATSWNCDTHYMFSEQFRLQMRILSFIGTIMPIPFDLVWTIAQFE
jgi:WD40 repeat protein